MLFGGGQCRGPGRPRLRWGGDARRLPAGRQAFNQLATTHACRFVCAHHARTHTCTATLLPHSPFAPSPAGAFKRGLGRCGFFKPVGPSPYGSFPYDGLCSAKEQAGPYGNLQCKSVRFTCGTSLCRLTCSTSLRRLTSGTSLRRLTCGTSLRRLTSGTSLRWLLPVK